jgi:hypothetical protein
MASGGRLEGIDPPEKREQKCEFEVFWDFFCKIMKGLGRETTRPDRLKKAL